MAYKIGTGECGKILIYQTDDGQTNIEVKNGCPRKVAPLIFIVKIEE